MSDPQDTQQQETAVKPIITRRGFIQGAIAGAALLGTAGVASLTNRASDITAAPAAQSGSGSGGGGGNQAGSGGGAKATPPPTTTPIDLTSDQLFETWIEPWVWRPSDWPGQQLNLNFVENENPGATIGFGNPDAALFSYGGITPGPTIRMGGNETLFVKLRNFLGANFGESYIKEFPDNAELVEGLTAAQVQKIAQDRGNYRHDWCLEEHVNGQHSARVTNLHTHGLHVRPGRNPDGTHSDNIILRIMPQADLRRRQASNDPNCLFLNPNEQVGQGDYEFRIGNVMGDAKQPHPPGTHWYHPHSHGATHDQVSSGMAGFLVVEGDVDEAINTAFGADTQLVPNLDAKTGPNDYRERLMFMQRVFQGGRAGDLDAPTNQPQKKNVLRPDVTPAINGSSTPRIILMRPGAVERWRVINGSVDGRGYKHFMVLKGQYVTDNNLLQRVEQDGSLTPMTLQDIEDAKIQLYQMAMDGVTFVEGDSQNARYVVRDLAKQNPAAATNYPLAKPLGNDENASMLENIHECFMAENIKDCYVRPNEVYMAPANRADLFFQAPATDDTIYTVVAKAAVLHADTYQQRLQQAVQQGTKDLVSWPQHIIVAYVVVKKNPYQLDPAPPQIEAVNVMNVVQGALDNVDVPPYLMPIAADEVMVPNDSPEVRMHTFAVGGQQTMEVEAFSQDVKAGTYRTRTILYSGWGAEGFPLVTTDAELSGEETAVNFQKFIAEDKGNLENLIYAQPSSQKFNVLMPPNTRTMSINNQFDMRFAEGDKRPSPRKFNPVDPARPIIFVGSAEEWALYNGGITLWGDDRNEYYGTNSDGSNKDHYIAYALSRGEGHQRFVENNHFRIVTRGVDHPFHMHTNPFWVMRIEIPDNDGNLVNILDKPRWQDTVWIPRHGGRIVFRSRFLDFAGIYVNHCHLLLHEDNGMMTPVETTFVAERSNYVPHDAVISDDATVEEVNQLYAVSDDPENYRANLRAFYRQSLTMVDPNTTGQVYPGFVVEPPTETG